MRKATMRSLIILGLATCLGAGAAPAHAQTATPVDGYLARAKAAAAFDFTGTLVRVCVAPQTAPGPDVAPAPRRRATPGTPTRPRCSTICISSAPKSIPHGR